MNEDDPGGGLAPSAKGDLTQRSSGLVRRGLEFLNRQPSRVLKFPQDRSVGWLYTLDEEGERWQYLGKAHGDVSVPVDSSLELELKETRGDEAVPVLAEVGAEITGLSIRIGLLPYFGEGAPDAPYALLEAIAAMPSLRYLDLSGYYIQDGIVSICEALPLRRLKLNSAKERWAYDFGGEEVWWTSTHEGVGISNMLEELARLPSAASLQSMSFNDTNLNDYSVDHFSSFPGLTRLDLSRTNITDYCLDGFEGMTSLEWLDLSDTCVTFEGVTWLKNVLPERVRVVGNADPDDKDADDHWFKLMLHKRTERSPSDVARAPAKHSSGFDEVGFRDALIDKIRHRMAETDHDRADELPDSEE